jgi:hypothetical protein
MRDATQPPLPRPRVLASLLLAAGVAAGVAAGCELVSVELTNVVDTIVAEVYLRPGEPAHQAFLHRTVPGPDGARTVEAARITVRGPAGLALEFVRQPNDQCIGLEDTDVADFGSCYTAADDGAVRPGETYDLEILLPGGLRLEGRTTVPAAFEVIRPDAPACVLNGPSLELVWTRSEGAWSYQADAVFSGLAAGLAARGVPDPPDTLRLLGLAVGNADTTMAFPQNFGVFDRFQVDLDILRALQQGLPDGARAEVVIAAGDRNYVNWARGGNFNPSGQIRVSSLTGDGIGVFASLLGTVRRIEAPGASAEEAGLPPCQ